MLGAVVEELLPFIKVWAGVIALTIPVLLLSYKAVQWMKAQSAMYLQRVFAAEPLLHTGRPGRGRIVRVVEAGASFQGEDNPVVTVTVEVMPDGVPGAVPYTTECTMWILSDDLPKFVPGAVHPVWIDPQNAQRIAMEGTPYALLREVARRVGYRVG